MRHCASTKEDSTVLCDPILDRATFPRITQHPRIKADQSSDLEFYRHHNLSTIDKNKGHLQPEDIRRYKNYFAVTVKNRDTLIGTMRLRR